MPSAVGGSVPELFNAFIAHVESFRVMVREWDDGVFTRIHSSRAWDSASFFRHVDQSYSRLRREQVTAQNFDCLKICLLAACISDHLYSS